MYNKIFTPEETNGCVPAALQTILTRRGIFGSQQEISKKFEETQNGNFNLGINDLKKFLENFELDARFYNPFTNIIEPDIFLREELIDNQDILLLYDLSIINNDLPSDDTASRIGNNSFT